MFSLCGYLFFFFCDFVGSEVMDVIQNIEGFKDERNAEQFANLLLQGNVIKRCNFRLHFNFNPKSKHIYEFEVCYWKNT